MNFWHCRMKRSCEAAIEGDEGGVSHKKWAGGDGVDVAKEQAVDKEAGTAKEQADDERNKKQVDDFFEVLKSGNWPKAQQMLTDYPELVHARNENDETVLMLEVTNMRHLKYLLSIGSDPNAVNKKGESPLVYAAKHRVPVENLQILLNSGASFHLLDQDGNPAISHVIDSFSEYVDEIEILFCGGVNHENHFGCTAFMAAVSYQYKHTYIAKLLMNAGCNPYAKDGKGRNAIMHLFQRFHTLSKENPLSFEHHKYFLPMLEILLDVGCDVYDLDNSGNMAIDYLLDNHEFRSAPPCNSGCNCTTCTMLVLLDYIMSHTEKLAIHSPIPHNAKFHPQLSMMQHVHRIVPDGLERFVLRIVESPLMDPRVTIPAYLNIPLMFQSTVVTNISFLKDCLSPNISQKYNAIDCFVEAFCSRPKEMKRWLDMLLKNGFSLTSHQYDEKVLAPMTLLVAGRCNLTVQEDEDFTMEDLMEFFIEQGADLTHRNLTKHFRRDITNLWSQQFQVSDALWIASAYGNVDCLRRLLPYWPFHPLNLLLFLIPIFVGHVQPYMAYQKDLLKKVLETLIPLFVSMGGLFNPGHRFEALCAEMGTLHSRTFLPDTQLVVKNLRLLHSSPPKLKHLCRTVLREHVGCSVGGHNLPEALTSIVPPGLGLKDFLNLQFTDV
ncbi:hypothetical protein B566_EDAN012577 [Ephemera danica]|nr:hypothetical protein B566_EDAN012577 [Ephemera danica]